MNDTVNLEIEHGQPIRWNGEALRDRAELKTRLEEAAAQCPAPSLHILPSNNADYAATVDVLSLCQEIGFHHLGLIVGDK